MSRCKRQKASKKSPKISGNNVLWSTSRPSQQQRTEGTTKFLSCWSTQTCCEPGTSRAPLLESWSKPARNLCRSGHGVREAWSLKDVRFQLPKHFNLLVKPQRLGQVIMSAHSKRLAPVRFISGA